MKELIEANKRLMDAILYIHPVFDMSNPMEKELYLAIHNLKDIIEQEKTESNAELVAKFIDHCGKNGIRIPDSIFESFFGA